MSRTKKLTTFQEEVQLAADEYERNGWLHKYRDQLGTEWWELTPLGRRALNLPPKLSQKQ
jgi:hypothetical protein